MLTISAYITMLHANPHSSDSEVDLDFEVLKLRQLVLKVREEANLATSYAY